MHGRQGIILEIKTTTTTTTQKHKATKTYLEKKVSEKLKTKNLVPTNVCTGAKGSHFKSGLSGSSSDKS